MVNLIFAVIAYLIGSVSFAVVVSKVMGLPDPHSYGSGNPGATNVLRTGNKKAAILTLIGDGLKGYVAVMLAKHFGPAYGVDETGIAMARHDLGRSKLSVISKTEFYPTKYYLRF